MEDKQHSTLCPPDKNAEHTCGDCQHFCFVPFKGHYCNVCDEARATITLSCKKFQAKEGAKKLPKYIKNPGETGLLGKAKPQENFEVKPAKIKYELSDAERDRRKQNQLTVHRDLELRALRMMMLYPAYFIIGTEFFDDEWFLNEDTRAALRTFKEIGSEKHTAEEWKEKLGYICSDILQSPQTSFLLLAKKIRAGHPDCESLRHIKERNGLPKKEEDLKKWKWPGEEAKEKKVTERKRRTELKEVINELNLERVESTKLIDELRKRGFQGNVNINL